MSSKILFRTGLAEERALKAHYLALPEASRADYLYGLILLGFRTEMGTASPSESSSAVSSDGVPAVASVVPTEPSVAPQLASNTQQSVNACNTDDASSLRDLGALIDG